MTAGHSLRLRCIPPLSYPPAYIYWVYKDIEGEINAVNLDERIAQDPEGTVLALLFLNMTCP